jgi:hypothetical protein
MIKKLALTLLLSGVAVVGLRAAANDDFETGPFTIGTYNGGTGFGVLTQLGGTNTGGTYAENVGTNNRQIDGLQSMGIFSGGTLEDLGRSITSPVTAGTFSFDARFDMNNGGTSTFSGVNLKSSLGAAFGDGELLSIGLVGNTNNTFLVTDSSGTHNVAVGTVTELRGDPFNFTINFNTTSETYSLTITDKANSQTGSISGSLLGVGSLGAVGFQNGDAEAGNQNLIIDNTTVTAAVPEPATVLLVGPALLGGMFFVRRRRA